MYNLALQNIMGASYYVLAAAEGSTQEAPIITYYWTGIHTKQATFLGSTHGCFLGASLCDIIKWSQYISFHQCGYPERNLLYFVILYFVNCYSTRYLKFPKSDFSNSIFCMKNQFTAFKNYFLFTLCTTCRNAFIC